MNARKLFVLLSLLTLLALSASACSPAAATPAPQVVQREAMAQAPAAQPTAAPAPTQAASSDQSSTNLPDAAPSSQVRMIIKNGEMTLLVADTDRALDQATGIAVDSGGYIVSSKTWLQDGHKYASLTMGIPSDQFEAAQRRLRGLALEVENDTASGQDVSQEYVDLQSRLTNLEATAARIREFLDKATKVADALEVNQQLSDVEGQIEQVKGRMQFLKDRSAFSTIALTLNPQVPTPTPTPTATPSAWQPGKTVESAGNALSRVLQGLGDMLIWLGIVVLPFAIPLAIVVTVIVFFNRRKNRKPGKATQPSSNAG